MTAPTTPTTPYAAPAMPARGTAELCLIADLGDDALEIVTTADPPLTPKAFIGVLVERGLQAEAVRFLAHALPRREGIWWAWVCARKVAGPEPEPLIKNALEATERWIVSPTEENRRQTLQAGEAADFGTPAGCAALAAFMSSGSLAPPDAPVVPPGEFMSAKAVAGSVTLAAVATEPDRAGEKFVEFVRTGLELADRAKLWPA